MLVGTVSLRVAGYAVLVGLRQSSPPWSPSFCPESIFADRSSRGRGCPGERNGRGINMRLI